MKLLKYFIIIMFMVFMYGSYYLYIRLPIINGYASKNLCSCIFVSGRTKLQAENNELNFSFIKFTNNKVDTISKTVTSSFFGFRPRTAYYNEKVGCALINYKKNINNFKKIDFKKKLIDYDKNDILKINIQKENKKLIQVAKNHFKETDGENTKNTTALLVVHKDELILEKYAEGFNKNNKFLGWSMAKSIMSTLIGVLVKEKGIDINAPLIMPRWENDARKHITLNNVLQMSTGIKWEEDYGSISDVTKMLYTEDNIYNVATNNKLEYPVGSYFEYSSGASNILSGQIREYFQTEKDYWEFPYRSLFSKIGAKSMLLETDPNGLFVGSSYAWATARDWCKYGMLYEKNGVWNGKQILPKDWIKYTTTSAENSNGTYGAQFWLYTKEEFPDVPSDMYFADGFQGQRIFIIPSKNLVIVRFGLSNNRDVNFNKLLKGIIKNI